MDTILIIEAKMTDEQLEVLVSEIKKISEIIGIKLTFKSESCSCDNGIIVCPGCDGDKQSEFGICAGCNGKGKVTCGKCGGKTKSK